MEVDRSIRPTPTLPSGPEVHPLRLLSKCVLPFQTRSNTTILHCILPKNLVPISVHLSLSQGMQQSRISGHNIHSPVPKPAKNLPQGADIWPTIMLLSRPPLTGIIPRNPKSSQDCIPPTPPIPTRRQDLKPTKLAPGLHWPDNTIIGRHSHNKVRPLSVDLLSTNFPLPNEASDPSSPPLDPKTPKRNRLHNHG